MLDGLLEFEDHVVRGGVWFRDRLSYLSNIAEIDAAYRHHRGRRRNFAARSLDRMVRQSEKSRDRLRALYQSMKGVWVVDDEWTQKILIGL